jgi:hypothetical protein
MKKSAQYRNIDGYDVITAIQDAVIDPAATAAAVIPLIEALPETAQARAIAAKIAAQQGIAVSGAEAARAKQAANPKADISAEEARWNLAKANIAAEEQNLKPVIAAIEAKKDELYRGAAVYFPPGEGEKHLSIAEETDLAPKWAALQEHEALTLAGEIIPDWRGTEYRLKTAGTWAKDTLEHIGEALPAGAVLPDALTEAQRAEITGQEEAARVAALTPEAKAAEKQAALDAAADEAGRLSRRAAIQGAAFDTAAYYAEKRAAIEEKYA